MSTQHINRGRGGYMVEFALEAEKQLSFFAPIGEFYRLGGGVE